MSQQQSRSLERADQPRLADYSQGLEGCDTGDDRKTCLFETLAGLCVSLDSLAEASSAKEPLAILNASSATSKRVTSELISETRPATCQNLGGGFGLEIPKPIPISRMK